MIHHLCPLEQEPQKDKNSEVVSSIPFVVKFFLSLITPHGLHFLFQGERSWVHITALTIFSKHMKEHYSSLNRGSALP